ncbi:hypothetical protein FRUB_03468 [Fimbriiglobus ruber]|uniref:Uncharacterized protein n=2 Tax=Fimbriiglobus ruber TaxID=1908690 RepID=A0A225E312_9BACT|nr:hypothetical protein FRUB_03468 [Fimbriiglobus ruber]
MLGCGNSKKVNIKELTPEQTAEQEATLKKIGDSEAEHRKNTPKDKTQQNAVDESERAHQQRR